MSSPSICTSLKIVKRLSLLLMILGFSNSYQGFSQESPLLLRVGYYENPPKVFQDENGKPSGIFVQILDQIGKMEQWDVKYTYGTWNECLKWLEKGEIDLVPDVSFSVERSEKFDFNKIPVMKSWSQIFSRTGLPVHQLSDLKDKRVAMLAGSIQASLFAQLMNGFDIRFTYIPVGTFEQAFLLVSKDLADASIVNYFFGESHYKEYGLTKTPLIIDPSALHFATQKGMNRQILNIIDTYLTDWKETTGSLYYQTLGNYMTTPVYDPEAGSNKKVYWVVSMILAALLVVIALLRVRLRQIFRRLDKSSRLLGEEERKFHRYIRSAPYGVIVVDSTGQYLEVNQAVCEITGFSEEELLGKKIPDLLSEESLEQGERHFGKVVTEGRASDTIAYINKRGEKRYWSVEAVKISENRFLGFVSDVTDRSRFDVELLEMKNSLAAELQEKTKELQSRIRELENFQEITIDRELRMEELRAENAELKKLLSK